MANQGSMRGDRRSGGYGPRGVAQQQAGTQSDENRFQRYPFNFAECDGDYPWVEEDHERYRRNAGHGRFHLDRKSGVIRLKLTARTPVFVPEGADRSTQAEDARMHFWKCWHEGSERHGIPASSIKGAVSTLYEIWTNSALRVVDPKSAGKEIPYRRRSATAFVVENRNEDGSIAFRRAKVKWVKKDASGSYSIRREEGCQEKIDEPWPRASDFPVSNNGRLDVGLHSNGQLIEYRANLFAVPKQDHAHSDYTHIAVCLDPPGSPVVADACTVTMYMSMLGAGTNRQPSSAFVEHPKRVESIAGAGAGRNYYRHIANETFENRQAFLARLEPGDLVWGIEAPQGKLMCFGKNVNFLWPSRRSPQEMLGDFFRDEASLSCDSASFGDLAFGFAGSHSDSSHPFRGRIQFSTFWKTSGHDEMPEVRLGPLTSPGGLKLKARPIYLPPGSAKRSQTYDEAGRLRGRKLYWHQKSSGGQGIHAEHRAESRRYESMQGQCPPPIHPLPRDTVFEGVVQFTNLTDVELGALAASLCPHLYFQKDARKFGWKIGKGKPRGLGSVVAEVLDVKVLDRDAWKNLNPCGSWATETGGDPGALVGKWVKQFREWLVSSGPLPNYVKDLESLLSIPTGDTLRNYHDKPGDYGWMPAFDDPKGDPKKGEQARPLAMPLARDTKP